MTSELRQLGRSTAFQSMLERQRAREEWEKSNPEIAAAWREASKEDHERTEAAEAVLARRKADESMVPRLVSMGVPLRCAEATVGPRQTPASTAAGEWWDGGTATLLLLGGVGAGKSVAGALMTHRAVYASVVANPFGYDSLFRARALFVRAAELSRATSSDYDDGDRARFEEWASTKLLVIDDLGAERAWDGWLSRLDELMDRRYGDKLRTIITTNLDADAFKARYGARIADRIRHSGVIASAGKDSLRRREMKP